MIRDGATIHRLSTKLTVCEVFGIFVSFSYLQIQKKLFARGAFLKSLTAKNKLDGDSDTLTPNGKPMEAILIRVSFSYLIITKSVWLTRF